MGKDWDGDKGGRDAWVAWMESVMRECLRVMKPGAHGLVWALPRTSHWTALALENAGFEIRDRIQHITGQGFPKSLDISKAIDKAAGAERKPTGRAKPGHEKFVGRTSSNFQQWERPALQDPEWQRRYHEETAPATDDAKRWAGFGTALKPACEDWWLVRKPIDKDWIVDLTPEVLASSGFCGGDCE